MAGPLEKLFPRDPRDRAGRDSAHLGKLYAETWRMHSRHGSRRSIRDRRACHDATLPQELDRLLPLSSLLDVGTGSGVLSIAAAKLGVRQIRAIDNDPTAVEVAEENVSMNSVWDQIRVSGTPLEELSEEFEVVVANIIAPVLLRLSADLVSATAMNGHLLLSGILVEEVDEVSRIFCESGMVEQARDSENGWSCLHLRRAQI